MKEHKKYKPYIRRINGREKANDFRTAIKLELSPNGYVMVQRGFPDIAIAAGKTKAEIKKNIVSLAVGPEKFSTWANYIKRLARGFQ